MATQAPMNRQPAVFIRVQQAASTSTTRESNPTREKQKRCRGYSLVVFGGIGIVLGSIFLIFQVARLSTGRIFAGVWGGLFLIGTGCVAIAAGRTRLRGAIIALLVMSIISIIMAGFILPACLAADFALTELDVPTEEYEMETQAILPILAVVGFACFLTISILSCVDICSGDCCNQRPRTQTANDQMVVLSPDGKVVPVQVIDASGRQHVIPVGQRQNYTPLQLRSDQHNSPAQPSAPPPPYSLHAEPPPSYVEEAAGRPSVTIGVY